MAKGREKRGIIVGVALRAGGGANEEAVQRYSTNRRTHQHCRKAVHSGVQSASREAA